MLELVDLMPDQLKCIDFMLEGEDSLIAADVGTGKTVMALTVAQEFPEIRWLVLAPLLVATNTWAQEPSNWEHLCDIKLAVACGSEAERIAAIESDAQVVVMNYENLFWLMERYPKSRGKPDPLPFNGLICDEIDKLKEVSSNRFKAFRNRIGVFERRIGLTGTLIPNKLTELWGQTYMADGGETFGRSFYNWRKTYFYPTDYNQYSWAPFPGTASQFLDMLGGLAYRLKATGLPEVVIETPDVLTMPGKVKGLYEQLKKDFYLVVDDAQGKRRTIDAANAAVLQGKLQQIAAGFSYVDGGQEAVWHSTDRFDWLAGLQDRLSGQQILVFYHFTEELEQLKARLPDLYFLGGGASRKRAAEGIRLWNAGEIPVFALHPASAGHGLNLQKSGAHHIAFLTMPWSGGMFKQVTGRLARRGNTADAVHVHTALYQDSVDFDVLNAILGKMERMEEFLDALAAA